MTISFLGKTSQNNVVKMERVSLQAIRVDVSHYSWCLAV